VVQFLLIFEKPINMQKLIFTSGFLFIFFSICAQNNKADVLQSLEQNRQTKQETKFTATLKTSSRLFGEKDDLTSVILIIPSGSVVNVIDSDSTYLKVVFEDAEGYILKRHAVISNSPVNIEAVNQPQEAIRDNQPEPEERISRFSYLEKKYGSGTAAKLYAGKIWKGITAEMVNDSWGKPAKINRLMRDGIIREEWIYRNTWLYIENNTLVEWGPIRK
jgi:hypothetical protein